MDDFAKFQNIAIKFLSYRQRSEKELREKLLKKKAPSDVLEKVIDFLKEQKFLDDEEFAKWWIRQRTEFNPKSLRIIKMELKQKGIDQETIENALTQHSSEELTMSDLEKAKDIVVKKLPKYKGLTKYELIQKLGPYLARRGFNYETIKQSIDEVLREEV